MPQDLPEINSPGYNKRQDPHSILPEIFAFAPNKNTLGATAYFIVNKTANILIDCPLWQDKYRDFVISQGGVSKLIITHRGNISNQIKQIKTDLNCQVIIQEQEAYLLPEIEVNTFQDNLSINPDLEMIWTPGHSPGSTCVYWRQQGGVLFTGRHLLPSAVNKLEPIYFAKTFHWWRQLKSVAKLRDRFNEQQLKFIVPGANTGYLRGKGYIDNAYSQLTSLNLEELKKVSSQAS